MTKGEIFATYVLPLLAAALTALAGYVGTQVKKLYEKHVNDKTKEAVVRTCVKAVEQLYHDLGGPEKLEKAKDGIEEMLNAKGIPISELEMNLLIESVVAEFNYGFAKASEVNKLPEYIISAETLNLSDIIKPAEDTETEHNSGSDGYSEEEGSR